MSPSDDTRPDEVELLRRSALASGLDPRVSPEDLGVRLDSPEDLLARLKTDPEDQAPIPLRRRRLGLLVAASTAAAATLVLGVLQPWQSSPAAADTPPVLDYQFARAQNIAYAPGNDAESTLATLAATARRTADRRSDGPVQHVVTDNWFASIEDDKGADAVALIPTVNETWLGTDGSLRLIERKAAPLTADGRGVPRSSFDRHKAQADETQPSDSIDPNLLLSLPTNPDRLRSALLTVTDCGAKPEGSARAQCLFDRVEELNSTYVVPQRVTAALWDLIAAQRVARTLGAVEDRAGRRGVGISLIPKDRRGYRLVLIADRKTGRVLGVEEILIKANDSLDVKAPAITRFTAFLASSYARNMGPTDAE
jgi:hypothetical protein